MDSSSPNKIADSLRRATLAGAEAEGLEHGKTSRAPYLDAAELRSDSTVGPRARKLLEASQEIGLRVLVSRPLVDAEADLAAIAALHDELDQRLVAWLTDRLGDRTPIPRPVDDPFKREERRPPPRRVCDVAFLALRELRHFGEDDLSRVDDGEFFLNLADWKKDAVIADAVAARDLRRMEVPDEPAREDGP
ncbi:MAG: hypothetical protein U0271_00290 [Polyangiaceae bacterium]